MSNGNSEQLLESFFNALDTKKTGYINIKNFFKKLNEYGIIKSDPRLKELRTELNDLNEEQLNLSQFKKFISPNTTLVEKILTGNLTIPDFGAFKDKIKNIFEETKSIKGGSVATYIPQLGRVSPDKHGMALCTLDGQQFKLGDANDSFVVQSTSKPISYCIALEEHGEEKVHQHIGREPSGIEFNGLILDKEDRPHNPMINAGAIMSLSLIRANKPMADRFEYITDVWSKLAGGSKIGFNNPVYLSENSNANRNFSLGHYMKEKNAFPENTNLKKTLEAYFQCCSIEIDCQGMSVVAATLANDGINPITGERVFSGNTVKHCLSLMSSCGMYDYSGKFAYSVGLPAKSGVSGIIMLVVPNTLGIAVWSPPIDKLGNSVRGLAFCHKLVNTFNFHIYESLENHGRKNNPRKRKYETMQETIFTACSASSCGDLNEIIRLNSCGVNLNQADYDGRTPLHLAASEGQYEVVDYLLNQGVTPDLHDRWGGTPFDDATRGGHAVVAQLLEKHCQNKPFNENSVPNVLLLSKMPKKTPYPEANDFPSSPPRIDKKPPKM